MGRFAGVGAASGCNFAGMKEYAYNPEINEILRENAARNARLQAQEANYDPSTGRGCYGPRRLVTRPGGKSLHLLEEMLADPEYSTSMADLALEKLRIRYDFEYWAWRCITITHKITCRPMPFVLNAPQRKLLAVMEDDRRAELPIRVILLKARQWGGSTLVGAYFAWIQIVLDRYRNSLIGAQVGNTAIMLRYQLEQILAHYPKELWEEDEEPALRGIKGSESMRIMGRDTFVTTTSSRCPDSSRGLNVALAHLSEVGFWIESRTHSREQMVRAICSGIPMAPLTAVVMESTANGSGSYFHEEWLRARNGESDKKPVFVAWHEVEMNRLQVKNPREFWNSLDRYERGLWERGLTLEMIAWYHAKRRGVSHDAMCSEYPTDDVEAFVHSGCDVFPSDQVAALFDDCEDPKEKGELVGRQPIGPDSLTRIRFTPDSAGELTVWRKPSPDLLPESCIVAVDVGGRSADSD